MQQPRDCLSESMTEKLQTSQGKHSFLTVFILKIGLSRESGNSYTDNNDNNDCMTVHFGDNQPFRMDGCASFNAYICEMKKDGTTVLYPPPVQNIQDGSNSHNSAYALWLLLFLIGLLFLTIMAFLCFSEYSYFPHDFFSSTRLF